MKKLLLFSLCAFTAANGTKNENPVLHFIETNLVPVFESLDNSEKNRIKNDAASCSLWAKRICKTKLCSVLCHYLETCEKYNIPACTIELSKQEVLIFSDEEVKLVLQENLTLEQLAPLALATAIHNELLASHYQ